MVKDSNIEEGELPDKETCPKLKADADALGEQMSVAVSNGTSTEQSEEAHKEKTQITEAKKLC
jgi:hypothetical protein